MSTKQQLPEDYRPPRDVRELLERLSRGEKYLGQLDLPGVNLTGAKLSEANLQGADLECSCLREADLR